ncbi:MAG TPA: flagellar filament capping protein FliD [Candidatus Baltobacteraceae bacterium]|nr:flagellar filament capping protein FliD [Candidatus Baltobacteraceae bacterium]
MAGLGSGNISNTFGTNVPPISFPGIASGIDYNSIIQKLTSLTLAPVTQINAQISTLNAGNAELLKLNGMLASVQNALTALSDPSIFNAYDATSSNTGIATASGIPSVAASPGTYVIDAAQLATATQVRSATNLGHTENDTIGGVSASNVPLIDSYAAITPSNGPTGQGSITIDGVTVKYDVTSQSLNTILANINAAVHAAGDASFNIGFVGASDTVQITDSSKPIALGSPGDSGNLLQVLRLDQAQVQNGATSGTVTATAGVGGINASLPFNSVNGLGQTTDANYLTPVTPGFFTINGVQINVSSTQNVYDVLAAINQSSAGVTASYNTANGQITLTNKNSGPQSIVLGSGSDSSNFLSATGLTAASGAATTLGTQAWVTVQAPGGAPQTVYSNSNAVTNAISGVTLNLQASDPATPFTVTVSQSSKSLVSAVSAFVSAYNGVIAEINKATAPPLIVQSATGGAHGAQSVGGGVLYKNADVGTIKNQLVSMVSGLLGNNPQYNSLASIGLDMSSSFQQLTANNNSGSSGNSQPISTQTINGTDGTLQPLNVQKLQAAMAANPTAVASLFSGANGIVTQIGTYLAGVTGVSTVTSTKLLGSVPTISLIQSYENAIQAQVQNLQQQVTQIQTNANMQADMLRQEFVASETAIAGYQALQQQLGSFFTSPGH